MGSSGEHLPDHACRGLARPPSVQACRRPACHTHITWHVTEYGLVSEEKMSPELQNHFLLLQYIHSTITFCVCSALEAVVVG